MPVALIVGAFGQDNPGDEALLDAAVAAVRARPGWDAVVATARPDETSARLDVAAVPSGDAQTAWAAARADALVVGGGTLFKELHPASGRRPGALLRRAVAVTSSFRARGRPVALLGVGAAPIRHAAHRGLARSLAKRADLLVLRDEDSARLLTAMGVPGPLRVGADLAWLATSAQAAAPPRTLAPVAIAVSHLAEGAGLPERLAEGVGPLARAGHPVEVEPWQGSPRLGADARLARRIAEAIGRAATVVPPPDDLGAAVARMAARSAVLVLRFHAALAAACAGTPFVALAHEPKLSAVARRTDQLSIGADASPAAVAEGLQRALLGPGPSPAAVEAEVQRARATADLLGLVLDGGGGVQGLEHLALVPEPVPT